MKTVCLDVDEVVANPYGPDGAWREYADREPYPFVRGYVLRLKAAGVTVLYQTARYMSRFYNDQVRAAAVGVPELTAWLDRHGLPHDGVFCGKVASDAYVDDKAFLLRSAEGPGGWDRLMEEMGAP